MSAGPDGVWPWLSVLHAGGGCNAVLCPCKARLGQEGGMTYNIMHSNATQLLSMYHVADLLSVT